MERDIWITLFDAAVDVFTGNHVLILWFWTHDNIEQKPWCYLTLSKAHESLPHEMSVSNPSNLQIWAHRWWHSVMYQPCSLADCVLSWLSAAMQCQVNLSLDYFLSHDWKYWPGQFNKLWVELTAKRRWPICGDVLYYCFMQLVEKAFISYATMLIIMMTDDWFFLKLFYFSWNCCAVVYIFCAITYNVLVFMFCHAFAVFKQRWFGKPSTYSWAKHDGSAYRGAGAEEHRAGRAASSQLWSAGTATAAAGGRICSTTEEAAGLLSSRLCLLGKFFVRCLCCCASLQ